MTDISVHTVDRQAEDRSWLIYQPGGSPAGLTVSGILDVSAFTKATHYPDGYFLSGLNLGKITATGLYGPYAGNANEVQTINLGAATAGTVTITFDGETTAAIAFNATAATVQAELVKLSNVNAGDITVTGGPLPGTVTLTFGGRYAGVNVPQVTVTPTGLTGGTVTVATTTEGGSAASDGRETMAGHLYSATKVPDTANTTRDVGVAVLEAFATVKLDKLPIALDAAGRAAMVHIHYIA